MAQTRQLATPTYLVAATLMFIPLFDALMQFMQDVRIHDPKWRFGVFGLASNALMIPLAGLLIAMIAAAIYEHRPLQKILGALSMVGAVGTLGLLCLFILDTLQVKSQVTPAAMLGFKVASLTASLKALAGVVTLSAFAYGAFRTPKVPGQPAGKAPRQSDIIVGTRPAGRPMPAASVRNPDDVSDA